LPNLEQDNLYRSALGSVPFPPPDGSTMVRSPDIIPSCGERLLRGYGETEAEVTARVVDDFCVQFLTYFRHGFRTMW
jgi:hypothetical protein